MDLVQIGGDIKKRGIHLVHGGIGAGKTENVAIPEAKNLPEGDSAIFIVPNVNRVYEIAELLGWPHYHAFGKDPSEIRQAFKTFPKLFLARPAFAKLLKTATLSLASIFF